MRLGNENNKQKNLPILRAKSLREDCLDLRREMVPLRTFSMTLLSRTSSISLSLKTLSMRAKSDDQTLLVKVLTNMLSADLLNCGVLTLETI